MENIEVRKRIFRAYNELVDEVPDPVFNHGSLVHDAEERRKLSRDVFRERSKYESCGRLLVLPKTEKVVRYHCRQAVCISCSRYWGRHLGTALVNRYDEPEHNDFSMITMVVAITADIDDLFATFKLKRKALQNAVRYQRSQGFDRREWRLCGLAASLEIDSFETNEFGDLGLHKQRQYLDLGFDPSAGTGTQWILTIHGIIRSGRLGYDTIRDGLRSVSGLIHIQSLDEQQLVGDACQNVVGYAAKVGIETTMAFGERREWPIGTIKTYISAVKRNSRGRQAFKIFLGPQKLKESKKKSTRQESLRNDEFDAMPFLFG